MLKQATFRLRAAVAALHGVAFLAAAELLGQNAEQLSFERVSDTGVIVDDTAELMGSTFGFRGKQRRIFVSKSFKTRLDEGVVDDGLARLFRRSSFFVYPSLDVTREQMTAAIHQGIAESDGALHGQAIHTVRLHLDLITPEMRQAAADHINRTYDLDGVVSNDQVNLVRYEFLEVVATGGGESLRLVSLPSVEIRQQQPGARLASHPESLEVELYGTREFLERFASRPRFELRFSNTGFQVRQNILHFSLAQLVSQGFHHFLTGDAKWEDLKEYGNSTGGGGADLLLFKFGSSSNSGSIKATKESWVTRHQARELITEVANRIEGGIWWELQTKDGMERLRTFMLDDLLKYANAERDFALIQDGSEFVIDKNLNKDVAPDNYTSLSPHVKTVLDFAMTNDLSSTANKTTKGSGKASTGKASSEASQDSTDSDTRAAKGDFKFTDTDDVSWQEQGNVIVPKSIRLFQFNQNSFNRILSRRYTETMASGGKALLVDVASIDKIEPDAAPVEILVLGNSAASTFIGYYGVVKNAPPGCSVRVYNTMGTPTNEDDQLIMSTATKPDCVHGDHDTVLDSIREQLEERIKRTTANVNDADGRSKSGRADQRRFWAEQRDKLNGVLTLEEIALAEVSGKQFALNRPGIVSQRNDVCFSFLGGGLRPDYLVIKVLHDGKIVAMELASKTTTPK